MTPQEVESYYGSKAEIARAVGCQLPSVYEWFEDGKGVPEGRQYQIELATNGVLKADKPANRIGAAPEVVTPTYAGKDRRAQSTKARL